MEWVYKIEIQITMLEILVDAEVSYGGPNENLIAIMMIALEEIMEMQILIMMKRKFE